MVAFEGLSSAEGGEWDVPGGFYQLHPREAVMPASVVQPMRDFFSNGGGAGAGGQFNVTIQALDAAGVKRLFTQQGGALVNALNTQMRNLNPGLTSAGLPQ